MHLPVLSDLQHLILALACFQWWGYQTFSGGRRGNNESGRVHCLMMPGYPAHN